MLFTGKAKYSLRDALVSNACGDILQKLYTRTIREDAGISYVVQADGGMNFAPNPGYLLEVVCPTKPLKADSAMLLINRGIGQIAKKGVDKQDLDDVVKFALKQYADVQRSNGFWAQLIMNKVMYGIDRNTGYEEAVKSITSADIQKFLNKQVLKQNNRVEVIMLPENTEDRQ